MFWKVFQLSFAYKGIFSSKKKKIEMLSQQEPKDFWGKYLLFDPLQAPRATY